MRVKGNIWLSILLPDGGIIGAIDTGPAHTVFERNHSIYRFDEAGNVMWQIKRNEGEWGAWEARRLKAEKENDVQGTSSFLQLWLRYPDGGTNRNPMPCDDEYPREDCLRDGAVVCCGTFDGRSYEIDLNTGIANIVSPSIGSRQW